MLLLPVFSDFKGTDVAEVLPTRGAVIKAALTTYYFVAVPAPEMHFLFLLFVRLLIFRGQHLPYFHLVALPTVAWLLIWVFYLPVQLQGTAGALAVGLGITTLAAEMSQGCVYLPSAVDTRELRVVYIWPEFKFQFMAFLAY